MMHYKLTLSYEDSMVAVGGSANMTKAAWSRNGEFIFYVEGPAGECLSRLRTVHRILRTRRIPRTLKTWMLATTMAIDDENTADITQALVNLHGGTIGRTRRHAGILVTTATKSTLVFASNLRQSSA
ncbi:hypothetical protein JG687_00003918 [Phytophthora cactorum]|uniref:Phospholipase D-like domain-containing protein n=1 Tax=Phytophthora cactorum TaxID=29920 RepID=A0A8T1UUN7_9STRA|nr:hypothetical protein JG687_00003918 [Phytophthora cactorum]